MNGVRSSGHKTLNLTEGPHGGGQVFGIPIDQCVANERSARLQQQQQQQQQLQQQQQSGINDDIQSDNGDTTSPVFRKSSHGSRTSFSSLIEGFKFDKVSIPENAHSHAYTQECHSALASLRYLLSSPSLFFLLFFFFFLFLPVGQELYTAREGEREKNENTTDTRSSV